jgi:preprotein translocase subunit SecF
MGYGIFDRGSKLFGVDFAGGDSTKFSFVQKLDLEQIRSALTAAGERMLRSSIKKTWAAARKRSA